MEDGPEAIAKHRLLLLVLVGAPEIVFAPTVKILKTILYISLTLFQILHKIGHVANGDPIFAKFNRLEVLVSAPIVSRPKLPVSTVQCEELLSALSSSDTNWDIFALPASQYFSSRQIVVSPSAADPEPGTATTSQSAVPPLVVPLVVPYVVPYVVPPFIVPYVIGAVAELPPVV